MHYLCSPNGFINKQKHSFMTIKRKYEKPSMQVFEMKQQPLLQQTSNTVRATMRGTFEEEDI